MTDRIISKQLSLSTLDDLAWDLTNSKFFSDASSDEQQRIVQIALLLDIRDGIRDAHDIYNGRFR